MKASVVSSVGGGFDVQDIELDKPMGREVLIDVKASGLCHSDLTLARAGIGYAPPVVLGHEVAGVVIALGEEASEFNLGDHVVASLIQFCGRCVQCRSGHTHACLQPEATLREDAEPARLRSSGGRVINQGFGLGGFAAQVLAHENQIARVPKALPFAQAALLGCGVLTGAGAVLNTAGVQHGETVIIIGAGGVGLSGIGGALLAGASRIIAIDVADGKLERARRFGATDVINSRERDPVQAVRALLPGGADYVFDFVGVRAVIEQGLQMLAKGGGLYLVGIGDGATSVELHALSLQLNQNRIETVYMGSSNLKRDIPFYAEMALAGRFNLAELVSREIALSQINDGFESLKDGAIARVVITDFVN